MNSLLAKLKALSPRRLAEVEDFVDFLRNREEKSSLVAAGDETFYKVFADVWDNDVDAEYDRLLFRRPCKHFV